MRFYGIGMVQRHFESGRCIETASMSWNNMETDHVYAAGELSIRYRAICFLTISALSIKGV